MPSQTLRNDYGRKTNYQPIAVYAKTGKDSTRYLTTTTWAQTCYEARLAFVLNTPDCAYALSDLVAHYTGEK